MKKRNATKDKIVKTALELFSSEGYYQTTTKKIAVAAKVNEVTIFRHFGTKENLFQLILDEHVTELNIHEEINDLIADDFKNTISNISRRYLEYCFKSEQLYKIQLRLSDSDEDFVRLKLTRDYIKSCELYFQTLKEENVISGDPRLMSTTLIEGILGAFTVYVLTNKDFMNVNIYDLVEEQARIFAKGYQLD
jgi:AcrR family transcriptional regulator